MAVFINRKPLHTVSFLTAVTGIPVSAILMKAPIPTHNITAIKATDIINRKPLHTVSFLTAVTGIPVSAILMKAPIPTHITAIKATDIISLKSHYTEPSLTAVTGIPAVSAILSKAPIQTPLAYSTALIPITDYHNMVNLTMVFLMSLLGIHITAIKVTDIISLKSHYTEPSLTAVMGIPAASAILSKALIQTPLAYSTALLPITEFHNMVNLIMVFLMSLLGIHITAIKVTDIINRKSLGKSPSVRFLYCLIYLLGIFGGILTIYTFSNVFISLWS